MSSKLASKKQTRLCNASVTDKARRGKSKPDLALIPTYEAPTTFTLFRKLPPELRIRIWRYSIEPRFVGLRFNKTRFKIPSILHANSESRYESKKHLWTLQEGAYGLVTNPTVDLLLMDSSSFYNSVPYGYHGDGFHTLVCTHTSRGPQFFDTNNFKDFTKICISVREVLTIWRRECLHCFFKRRFVQLFPSVTEVNIVLRPGPESATPKDMYIVNVEDEEIILYHKQFMLDVMSIWKRAIEESPRLKAITIQFVRVERWPK